MDIKLPVHKGSHGVETTGFNGFRRSWDRLAANINQTAAYEADELLPYHYT